MALLDATVACLVDGGLSRTTATAVAHRAGLSLGALAHHYPTKSDLLGAAVEHVIQQRILEFQDAMAALDSEMDLIDASVEALWAIFSGDAFVAWVELWIGARTDTKLAAAVTRVEWTFLETAEVVFSELFGEHAAYGNPLFRRIGLQMALTVLGGLALNALVPGGRTAPGNEIRRAFIGMVKAALESGIGEEPW